MKWFNSLNLKNRLIFALLFFGVAPAVTISLIAVDNLKSLLVESTKEKLNIEREEKAQQLTSLFSVMSNQVLALSTNIATIQAMNEFSKTFDTYDEQFEEKPDKKDMMSSLQDYYTNKYGNNYVKINGGKSASHTKGILEKLSADELALQYSYISNNENPMGSKDALPFANDNTDWSMTHKKFHPTFKKFLESFGFYDVFLVEPDTGHIVYSVFKELDFATSLLTGPYANSNLAKAFKKSNASSGPDMVSIVDLEKYSPSYDAPAGFIASPIYDGVKKIGVLIFQIPVEKINKIMTSEQKWKESGYGDSGETYLVGQDKKMRSVSRFLMEDPEGYFKVAKKIGLTDEDVSFVRNMNTTAIVQTVDSEGIGRLIKGEDGFSMFEDYRGTNVFSSYRSVLLGDGLTWYILAEIDEAEALPLTNVLAALLGILALSIIIIVFFSWYLSTTLSKRIQEISIQIKDSAKSTQSNSEDLQSTSQNVSEAAIQQASAIQETVSTLNEISAMVNKSVDYANKSAQKSQESEAVTKSGQEAVVEMNKAMAEIDESNVQIMNAVVESNEQISGVVKVIQEIAVKTNVINDIVFQTKLLSFNASVEAARAGDHGKGFTVVAEEVGNLAQMSGSAAQEIGAMLSESIVKVEKVVSQSGGKIKALVDSGKSKVQMGVEVSRRCGEVLEEVVSNVSEVHKMMGEVSSASSEQAEGVNNITTAMNELESATNSNSTSASESSNLASNLTDEASKLQTAVLQLEKEVNGVNTKIKKTIQSQNKQNSSSVVSIDRHIKPTFAQHEQEVNYKNVANGVMPSYDDPGFEDI
ncbi:MAG: hypothetical protein HOO06_06945 [Bdellovibrionaceae bacterium]|jgi:methyl-accepting chemotaxis protein|nr:hypothetical protein [Pseudobdellovibrionaceae bacterium]